ncbi:MAG: RNA methyltransferase [Halothiobacillaceae bacterium]
MNGMGTLADRLRIVMVETSHPGNIGSAARAMKTMGLGRLVLVRPACFPDPDGRDRAMASGADDLLGSARVVDSLDEALAESGFVVGATARLRAAPMPMLDARAAALESVARARKTPVSLLFGREHSGLTNAEMNRCHALLHIPASSEYGSLNIAAAIQVVAYELRMAALGGGMALPEGPQPAPVAQLEGYLEQLRVALESADFLDPQNPRHLMQKLRALYLRAEPTENEINILRGVVSALCRGGSTGARDD